MQSIACLFSISVCVFDKPCHISKDCEFLFFDFGADILLYLKLIKISHTLQDLRQNHKDFVNTIQPDNIVITGPCYKCFKKNTHQFEFLKI